jgi:hypothetical protein
MVVLAIIPLLILSIWNFPQETVFIEVATPLERSTPRPTQTVAPEPIPIPEPLPLPRKVVTPVATPQPTGEEVTAQLIARRCVYYTNTTLGWLKREDSNFNVLTTEDLPLILAVMAQESACDPNMVSTDGHGSVGLMQVIPRDWLGACLDEIPCNIYWGIWILDRSIDQHGLEKGLAVYNCSLEKVEADLCGPYGGMNYADKILNYWLPYFE